jgi:hypothetical protein
MSGDGFEAFFDSRQSRRTGHSIRMYNRMGAGGVEQSRYRLCRFCEGTFQVPSFYSKASGRRPASRPLSWG